MLIIFIGEELFVSPSLFGCGWVLNTCIYKWTAVHNLQKHSVQLTASGGREVVTSRMAGEENKVRVSL